MKPRKLLLVLADGLRPEAITPSIMPTLHALSQGYASAVEARTIRPSVTVAALASLATGVAPEEHRLVEPGLDFLPRLTKLRPVARELARHDIPADVVTAELPIGVLPLAWALTQAAGARRLFPGGQDPRDTAMAADWLLRGPDAGLVFVYLPACDDAGHKDGWMSPAYLNAAAELDGALAPFVARLEDALLIVVADHGGGGVIRTEHHHPHPINERIPLILAGPGVAREQHLEGPVSLLDVSATILWWFGVPVPASYDGRPLVEAFAALSPVAVAAQ